MYCCFFVHRFNFVNYDRLPKLVDAILVESSLITMHLKERHQSQLAGMDLLEACRSSGC